VPPLLVAKYTKQKRKILYLDNKYHNTTKQNDFPFNHRVKNLTQIQFTKKKEIHLLNKGLQYNLHYKEKLWIETLALEAETAISYLDASEQDHMRHLVANNLKHLVKNQPRNSKDSIKEWNTIKNIKQKLADNNSVVMQTDKGKEIVIIHKQDYDKYIESFITNNNFELLNKDPTNTYKKRIKESINSCKILISNKHKYKYYNNNPNPPTLHALIKLHKTPITIRPVINWRNAPAYKLSSFFLQGLYVSMYRYLIYLTFKTQWTL
jgi:hypothetical protein